MINTLTDCLLWQTVCQTHCVLDTSIILNLHLFIIILLAVKTHNKVLSHVNVMLMWIKGAPKQ